MTTLINAELHDEIRRVLFLAEKATEIRDGKEVDKASLNQANYEIRRLRQAMSAQS